MLFPFRICEAKRLSIMLLKLVCIVLNKFTRKVIIACILLVIGLSICGMLYVSTSKKQLTYAGDRYLPIIMYHSLLKESQYHGRYIISPNKLEEDLIYIRDNGYTTITIKDLLDYVYNGRLLPAKPIMLTFDDGNYNNYYYAFPLLRQYNCKAVISPIISITEEFSQSSDILLTYGYCSFTQLKEMSDSGLFEVQNHSYSMHAHSGRVGVGKKQGEPDDLYKTVISEDINKAQLLIEQNIGTSPTCFTYPFGHYSKETPSIIKELNFKASLGCYEKLNCITRDPDCLYELGRFLRNNTESSEHLFKRMEK